MNIRTLYIFLLIFIPAVGSSQVRIHRQTKVTKEYYPSGKLMKITKVKTAQTVGYELGSNFKKTYVRSMEFFEDGKPKSYFKKKTKIGSSGKNCYEIKSLTKNYYESGELKQFEIHKCDKGKSVFKFYDEKGKLTFTRIVYDVTP
jgi:antitoxin component YwqK of YwqJK toxin-antitoxin module